MRRVGQALVIVLSTLALVASLELGLRLLYLGGSLTFLPGRRPGRAARAGAC